jgi:hypothetical protein
MPPGRKSPKVVGVVVLENRNRRRELDPVKYSEDDLDDLRELAEDHVRKTVTPTWTYFKKTVLGTLAPMVELLKICRLSNPYAFAHLKPTAEEFNAAVASLDVFDADEERSISQGYAEYMRISLELPSLPRGSSPDDEMKAIKTFWRAHHATLNKLSPFVRYCFTIQCSSAAVERVFSVLKNSFGDQQELSLEDYVCLSLIRQFNKRADL